MQVRAHPARPRARDRAAHVEVMVPLVDYERELEFLRELIDRDRSRGGHGDGEDYTVGTMIELPRACLHGRPDRPATPTSSPSAPMTSPRRRSGFSRDDIEGSMLAATST